MEALGFHSSGLFKLNCVLPAVFINGHLSTYVRTKIHEVISVSVHKLAITSIHKIAIISIYKIVRA